MTSTFLTTGPLSPLRPMTPQDLTYRPFESGKFEDDKQLDRAQDLMAAAEEYIKANDPKVAVANYEEVLRILKELRDRKTKQGLPHPYVPDGTLDRVAMLESEVMSSLAEAYDLAGEYENAIKCFRKAMGQKVDEDEEKGGKRKKGKGKGKGKGGKKGGKKKK
jgi:tetratricopeptide (TPR) repeat protein